MSESAATCASSGAAFCCRGAFSERQRQSSRARQAGRASQARFKTVYSEFQPLSITQYYEAACPSPSAPRPASRPRPPVPPRRTAAPTPASCAGCRCAARRPSAAPAAPAAPSTAPARRSRGRGRRRARSARARRWCPSQGPCHGRQQRQGSAWPWRGRARQRTGPAKWVRKKCEHGRKNGQGLRGREHLPA